MTSVVVSLGLAVTAVPAFAAAPSDHIANDTGWKDAAGNEIKAQGGNVFREDDVWYWVGTSMDPKVGTVATPKSINLYSSPDLENWSFVKALVTQSDDPSSIPHVAGADMADLAVTGSKWLGRPQLIHKPGGKYVIWVEVGGGKTFTKPDGTVVSLGNGQGVFTSDAIDGTYTYQGKQFVSHRNADGTTTANTYTSGDRSVFIDGGNAYLVYVGDSLSGRNADINVAPLDSTWQNVGKPIITRSIGGHEAPGMVKVGSTYYLFASGQHWWAGTPTSYLKGASIETLGTTWNYVDKAPNYPDPAKPSTPTDSFGTQFEQIIPVTDAQGVVKSYLYNGDRYSQWYTGTHEAPSGSGRNAWYPVTFDSAGVPTLHGATDVDVDATSGTLTWNYIANGRFDQRRHDDAAGANPYWTLSGTAGVQATSNPVTKQQLVLGGTNTSGSATQAVTLPAGSYTLGFDYKTQGAANHAAVTVTGTGVTADPVDLTAPQSTFAHKTVTFTVGGGTVTLSAAVDSSAWSRLQLDNVTLWRD
ncbi:family 43 glycosylhydrolase [Herbiconiux sp. P17]|uniref:family 43 glycosylhydrolase n=1 Tax=Herbiconiux wuyangfengii TaxID=3342794 RepID=UPI0035B7E7D3